MKIRALASVAGAAAMTASLLGAAPVSAAPAQTSAGGGIVHCILAADGSTTCGSSQTMRARAATSPLLFAIHDKKNYRGMTYAFHGKRCSASTTGGPDYVVTPSFVSGRGNSVTKYKAGHCNWQLVGAKGKRSTWVEGSRPNLGVIGSGWNNRAVRVRLT